MDIDKLQCMNKMGDRLYELRKVRKLSQEDVAEIVNISQQAISEAERGNSFLSIENIIKLSLALNISCDYLLMGKTTNIDLKFHDDKLKNLDASSLYNFKKMTEHFIAALDKSQKKD